MLNSLERRGPRDSLAEIDIVVFYKMDFFERISRTPPSVLFYCLSARTHSWVLQVAEAENASEFLTMICCVLKLTHWRSEDLCFTAFVNKENAKKISLATNRRVRSVVSYVRSPVVSASCGPRLRAFVGANSRTVSITKHSFESSRILLSLYPV